jgi:HK97 family phage major capsid protein
VKKVSTSRDRVVQPKVPYAGATDDPNGYLYSTPVRGTWTGELLPQNVPQATPPTFGTFEIPVNTLMMSVNITNDQLEDTPQSIMEFLRSTFEEFIDGMRENMILNGTGAKQPTGILTRAAGAINAPKVVTTATSGTLADTDLVAFPFTLPPQYQRNAKWGMSWINTASAIRQMADSAGRFLWGWGVQQSGLSMASYDMPLLGKEINYSEFFPAISAGSLPILYGDLAGYMWVNRIGMSIQVLNEISALQNQKVLLGRIRVGGDLAEEWKINVLKIHA